MNNFYKCLRSTLFKLDPEVAHNMAIFALKNNLILKKKHYVFENLIQKKWNLAFQNPVGIAAGFDKNGDCIDSLLNQNFGFIEIGTVTPLPQDGNTKPRIFRLEEDSAVINRLGFNNKGINNLKKNVINAKKQGILGINIGKNKDNEDPISDYVLLINQIYNLADYITVNISSPNTPGLRNLQNKDNLNYLLTAIYKTQEENIRKYDKHVPILIKIAPDLDIIQQKEIASLALTHEVDGLIISNTTLDREYLINKHKTEIGGLSGMPLMAKSTQILANMYRYTEGSIPLIGVGGVSSAQDAYKKIKAGASLVQLYTALVYQGFSLVNKINKELSYLLDRDGFQNITQAIGIEANLYE